MKSLIVGFALMICVAPFMEAQADKNEKNYCSADLATAIASYNEGDYQGVTEIFSENCLDPEAGLLDYDGIRRGYKVLIMSYWGLDYDEEGNILYNRFVEYIKTQRPELANDSELSDRVIFNIFWDETSLID